MIALTIGGQAGAGAPEIGSRIARTLSVRYVEHLALRRLARRLDATAEAVTKKELSFGSRRDRFLQLLELMFSRIGWYGADAAMGGGPPAEYLVDMFDRKKRLPAEISTTEYVAAIHDTADQFADEGSLLLVKRAGCITLKDRPDVTHVGLFAPRDLRVARVSERLSIGAGEAEDIVTGLEHARTAWFDKIGQADPQDHRLYDVVFNLGDSLTDNEVIRQIIVEANRTRPVPMNDGYRELALVK